MKRNRPQGKTIGEVRLEHADKRIRELENVIDDMSKAAVNARNAQADQLKYRDELISRLKEDSNRDLARLGARLAALEYSLVLNHQRAGMIESINVAQARELTKHEDAVHLAAGPTRATPQADETPMYRRIPGSDRWDLVVG